MNVHPIAFDGLVASLLERPFEPGAAKRREELNRGTLCREDLEVAIDGDAHERGVIRGTVVERKP